MLYLFVLLVLTMIFMGLMVGLVSLVKTLHYLLTASRQRKAEMDRRWKDYR